MLTGGRFGDPLTGARVLDLFSGTGALGLEALSRGATSATFVDSGRAAQKLVSQNIATLNEGARTRVISRDATRLGTAETAHDLIFLDPPYGTGLGERAMHAALTGGWVAPEALIVWEDSAEPSLPDGLGRIDARRYGDSWITLARAQ